MEPLDIEVEVAIPSGPDVFQILPDQRRHLDAFESDVLPAYLLEEEVERPRFRERRTIPSLPLRARPP